MTDARCASGERERTDGENTWGEKVKHTEQSVRPVLSDEGEIVAGRGMRGKVCSHGERVPKPVSGRDDDDHGTEARKRHRPARRGASRPYRCDGSDRQERRNDARSFARGEEPVADGRALEPEDDHDSGRDRQDRSDCQATRHEDPTIAATALCIYGLSARESLPLIHRLEPVIESWFEIAVHERILPALRLSHES